MADENKIISELELRGDEEVKRRLASVGDEGAASLDKLSKAGSDDIGKNLEKGLDSAAKAASGFSSAISQAGNATDSAAGSMSGINSVVNDAAGAFDSLAVKVVASVVAIVAGVSAATSAMAKIGADAASAISDGADKLGLTAEAYQRLIDTAGEAGLSTDQFGQALGRVNSIADEIGRSFLNIEGGTKNAAKAFLTAQDATLDLAKAQRELGSASADAARSIVAADLSVEGSKLSLKEAENALNKARGLAPRHSERALAIDKAELAVKQAKLNVEKAEQAAAGATAAAREDSGRRILAVQKAVNKLVENSGAAFQKYANTIHQFGESTVQVLRGTAGAVQGASSTISQVGRGVTEQIINFENATVKVIRFGQTLGNLKSKLTPAQAAIQALGINLQNFVRMSPEERLRALATAFSKVTDPARRAALASAIWGDNWRTNLALMDEIQSSIKKTGDLTRHFTDQEIESAKALKGAQADLGEAISRTLGKIGLLFAPGLTRSAEWMTGLVDGARDLVLALSGAEKEKKKLLSAGNDSFAAKLFRGFEQFKKSGAEAFAALDQARVSFLAGMRQFFSGDFAGAWESFKRSGTQALSVVSTGLATISRKLAETFPDLVPFWNTFKQAGVDAFASVKTGLSTLGSALKSLLAGDFAGAWVNFKQAGVSAFTALKQLMAPVWAEFTRAGDVSWDTIGRAQSSFASAFRNLFQGNFTKFWQDLARSAGAAWSFIRSTGQAAWEALTTDGEAAFTDLSSSQKQFTSGFDQLFSGDFAGAWDKFVDAGSKALSSLGNAFESASTAIKRTFGVEVSASFLKIVAGIGAATVAFFALRSVITPVLGVVGGLVKSLLTMNPVMQAIGLAAVVFWQRFAKGATGAVQVLGVVQKAFGEGIKKILAGDLAGAWNTFRTAGVAVWRDIRAASQGFFTPILAAFRGLMVVLEGMAVAIRTVFGVNITGAGVALLLVLAQLSGAFTILTTAAILLGVALNPAIRVFALMAAAALVLYRLFPDLGQTLSDLGEAAKRFFSGDLQGAAQKVREAFSGFFKNLAQEGPLTFLLLAGALAIFVKSVVSARTAVVALAATMKSTLTLFAPFLALMSAFKLIDDVTGDGGKATTQHQKLLEKYTAALRTGSAEAEKYAAELRKIEESTKEAATATDTGTTDIGLSWQKVLESIKGTLSGIPTEAEKATASAVNVFKGGVGKSQAEWDKLDTGKNIRRVPEAAKKAAAETQQLFAEIGPAIDQSLANIQNIFEPVGQAADKAGQLATTSFNDVAQSVDAVKSGTEGAVEAVKKLDQGATLDKMTQAAGALHGEIEKDKTAIQQFLEKLSQPGADRIKGLTDGLRSEFNDTVDALSKSWKDFIDFISKNAPSIVSPAAASDNPPAPTETPGAKEMATAAPIVAAVDRVVAAIGAQTSALSTAAMSAAAFVKECIVLTNNNLATIAQNQITDTQTLLTAFGALDTVLQSILVALGGGKTTPGASPDDATTVTPAANATAAAIAELGSKIDALSSAVTSALESLSNQTTQSAAATLAAMTKVSDSVGRLNDILTTGFRDIVSAVSSSESSIVNEIAATASYLGRLLNKLIDKTGGGTTTTTSQGSRSEDWSLPPARRLGEASDELSRHLKTVSRGMTELEKPLPPFKEGIEGISDFFKRGGFDAPGRGQSKNIEDVRTRKEDSILDFSPANRAIQEFGSELGSSAANIRKHGDALPANIKRYGDASNQAAENIKRSGDALPDNIKRYGDASNKAADNLDQLGETSKQSGTTLGDALQELGPQVDSAFSDLAPNIDKAFDNLPEVGKGLDGLENQFEQLPDIGKAAGDWWSQFQQDFEQGKLQQSEGVEDVSKVEQEFSETATAADKVTTVFGSLSEAVGSVITGIQTKIQELIAPKPTMADLSATTDPAKAGADAAAQQLATSLAALNTAFTTLVPAFTALNTSLTTINPALTLFGTTLTTFTTTLTTALTTLQTKLLELSNPTQATPTEGADASGQQGDGLSELATAIQSLAESINTGFSGLTQSMSEVASAVGQIGAEVGNAISGAISPLAESISNVSGAVSQMDSNLSSTFNTGLQSITSGLQSVQSEISSAASQIVSAIGQLKPSGMAGGGRIRGSGTGTSDSVPIMASVGEWIVRARAVRELVRKYGPQIMSFINQGRIPGFAEGGIVMPRLSLPRLAEGGSVSGMPRDLGELRLRLDSGQILSVFADEQVANSLSRYAVVDSRASAGRLPSAHGRRV